MCETKFSGKVSCSPKYSSPNFGMKIRKHKRTDELRYYCRYNPNIYYSKHNTNTGEMGNPLDFGPEIRFDISSHMSGKSSYRFRKIISVLRLLLFLNVLSMY